MTARRRKEGRGRDHARKPRQDHRAVRLVTDRAIRRLGLFESLILGAAALAALAGGALVAFLVSSEFGAPFRTTWLVASLLFFLVPGAATLLRRRRDPSTNNPADDSGWRNEKD